MTNQITPELQFQVKPNKQAIKLQTLSVNKAWQGKRFKTAEYKKYEQDALFLMPKIIVPPGRLKLILEIGFSNIQSDIDNPVKMILDILQKKYWFNDSNIWELSVTKHKVNKGSEFFSYEFISMEGRAVKIENV
jgi:Holliday junction resolvase RusA-like endonuclease